MEQPGGGEPDPTGEDAPEQREPWTDDEARPDDEVLSDDEARPDDEVLSDDEARPDDEVLSDDEARPDDEVLSDDEARPDDEVLSDDEVVDVLPDDLKVSDLVGPHTFPNNNRRRIPGVLYLVIAAACLALWLAYDSSPLVNAGFAWAALGLGLFGVYNLVAGSTLRVDEGEALLAATRQVGFPVGHASAQMGWRGLLSRPTWRILLYSAENPPAKRGLVLIDGMSGEPIEYWVEDNPEAWE